MVGAILVCLMASGAAAPKLSAGTILTYRGEMLADKGDPAETRKTFELRLVIAAVDAGQATIYWTLKEQGRGAWAWPNHFGKWQVDPLHVADNDGPALLYQRPEGKSVVPLAAPLLSADQAWAKGVRWNEGKLEYNVAETETVAGYPAWQVIVTTAFGHKRTYWVAQNSPVVVRLRETVFIGQGEKHVLAFDLADSQPLTADELQRTVAGFDAFAKLRDRLRVKPYELTSTWNADQLAMLKSELPGTIALADGNVLAGVAAEAELDADNQRGQNGAISALSKRTVGKPVSDFKLEGLSGETLTHENLAGRVTVLHFWEYGDTPLEEPYGQVGYLDYLSRQRQDGHVRVYGVAVDARLGDPDARRAAIAGAKKLRSFMNLSYPVLLDDGKVIKQFGDPRVTGAKLPLYIVVGADGKVLHYHAGFYEVQRERGLQELDGAVTQALQSVE